MAGPDIPKGKRVLVVDDEPDILETLMERLDTSRVETASSYNIVFSSVLCHKFSKIDYQ